MLVPASVWAAGFVPLRQSVAMEINTTNAVLGNLGDEFLRVHAGSFAGAARCNDSHAEGGVFPKLPQRSRGPRTVRLYGNPPAVLSSGHPRPGAGLHRGSRSRRPGAAGPARTTSALARQALPLGWHRYRGAAPSDAQYEASSATGQTLGNCSIRAPAQKAGLLAEHQRSSAQAPAGVIGPSETESSWPCSRDRPMATMRS